MVCPAFQLVDFGNRCFAINDRGRTVATVTSQGYIDWVLRGVSQSGPLITEMHKETHLGLIRGLKLVLHNITPATELQSVKSVLEDGGARLVLQAHCMSADGRFASETIAELAQEPGTDQYQWVLASTITCLASAPVLLHGFEYNNILPGKTGRCMLFTPTKEYSATLMSDRDGTIWRFPHQHLLHYSNHIHQLRFAAGTISGYFGDPAPMGVPVVIVDACSDEPDWAICDMYYDLHCQARVGEVAQPRQRWHFQYRVKYLDEADAARMLAQSRPIPITLEDWERCNCPRFALGMNTFTDGVNIDRPDDASGFRPHPPQRVWDRQAGHRSKGSLRLTNIEPHENVWSAVPPTQIPSAVRLNITAMVQTQQVRGKGAFIRVRYHTFNWWPTPHVAWTTTLESVPVTGDTHGWVKVAVPELQVPAEHVDYLVWIDVVLEGEGIAWVTDVDVDQQPDTRSLPSAEEGSTRQQTVRFSSRRSVGASL